MKKYSCLILLIIYSNLFAQTEQKSILYLESESKQLIENSFLLSDSIYSENIFKEQHSVGNILAQTLIGSIFSLGTGFISLGISYGIAYSNNNATFSTIAFSILVPSSLIFGSAIGVHLIARQENPKHSFWQTVKYSAYGAGSGVVLSLLVAAKSKEVTGGEALLIILTPLIGSLIYSNYIADWPVTNQKVKLNEITFKKLNYSFVDYYESTQIFRINILSIAF